MKLISLSLQFSYINHQKGAPQPQPPQPQPQPQPRRFQPVKSSEKSAMSHHQNNGKSPKPELKLNLSLLPRGEPSTLMRMETDDDGDDADSPNRMSMSSSEQSLASPPSSCVSSENSPEASKAMVLAGCPRCLMYVMLSEDEEPKCPKCKNAVLLDFGHDKNKNKNKNGKS